MIALVIDDTKGFVNKLLIQNTFDKFYIGESTIRTFTDFKLGGSLNEGFYASDEIEVLEGRQMCLWSEIKPFAYDIIKGRRLPLSFFFVFQLSNENTKWLLEKNQLPFSMEQVGGLYINVRYEKGLLQCVTGISMKTFVMDKTLEHIWDDTVKQFFKQNQIEFTIPL